MAADDRLFLTPGQHGEVAELTGAHTKAGQIRNLQTNGIRHSINAAGWPVVPVSAIDGAPVARDPKAWTPRVLAAALLNSGKPVKVFGLTASGDPKHPLMLGYDTQLVEWRPA
jgi:hypothetical protein